MKVLLFSSTKSVQASFEPVVKTKHVSIEIHPPQELRKVIRDQSNGTIVYLDISGMEPRTLTRTLRYLAKEPIPAAVIDPKHEIKDVAELFRMGFFDYLNRPVLKVGVKPSRLCDVFTFAGISDNGAHIDRTQWKLSGDSWKGIRSGQEYTFLFMFIELDLNQEWKKKSGRQLIDDVLRTFHSQINKTIAPHNGRIWMWMDLGGVILFPFNGKTVEAVRSCIRLVYNRNITSAEAYDYNTLITFRVAMHIGNTIYKTRGQTGTIISDTVNFVFHLGQQFAQPGNCYITDEVFSLVPDPLKTCFTDPGSFSEHGIHRLRLPVPFRPSY